MSKKLGLDKQYKNLYTHVNKNSPSGLSKGITKPFKSTGKRIMEIPIVGSRLLSQKLNKGGLSAGQKRIAAKAPPTNKIDGKDFAVLRAEKAKGRGKGLQDEKMKPGKVMKANLGLMLMKKAKDKGAKGPELLSPLLMAKRLLNKGGKVMKANKGKVISE